MLRFPLTPILLVLCTALLQKISAQEIPEEFNRISDSIFSLENISYDGFQQVFNPYRKDSVILENLIEKSKKRGLWKGLSYGYNQFGELNSDILKYQKAIEYYKLALEASSDKEDIVFRSHTLNMLGKVSMRVDSIRNALDYHQEVIYMADARNTEGDLQIELGKAYFGIGNIYKALGQWALSMNYYNTALDNFQTYNYFEGLVYIYQNMGESLEAIGKLDEALYHYGQSEEINNSLGSERSAIINSVGIAHIMVHQGDLEEARTLIESSISRSKDLRDDELLTLGYIQYGWNLMNMGRLERAEDYLLKGLELSEKYQLTDNLADAANWLHELYAMRGDYKNTYDYYKLAVSTRSRIRNKRNQRYVYDAVSRSEEENKNTQLQILATENEMVNLKLRRNHIILIIGALWLGLLSLVLFLWYRQNKLKNEKQILSLEQGRLRSQMNPHFLFNSLNSIKHMIISNDEKNAIKFLNKFSKLIRKILDASSYKEITLEEELETTALYMNIENMRFNNAIDFSVEVDPEIDPTSIKIPSLILQPFLENSLWHGLSSINGQKIIRIIVTQNKKGYISINIRDNGIGREAAGLVKNRKLIKRKSMGISITKERLANFSRLYQNTFNLSFQDIFGDDGKVKGTEVSLLVPTL